MSTDFPTAPLAPGHKGAGGGAVEKSHHASHTKNLTLPGSAPSGRRARLPAAHAAVILNRFPISVASTTRPVEIRIMTMPSADSRPHIPSSL